MSLPSAIPVVRAALKASARDRVPMMGAALAYYTVFSIAPLLVISMGLAGVFFGARGSEELLAALSGVAGDNAAAAITSLVEGAAARPRAGLFTTVIGVVTLLVGASGVFGQLQESLNVIWGVRLAENADWHVTLRRRLTSFGMVGVIAFILLASLIVTAALAAAGRYAADSLPGGETAWQIVNSAASFAVISGLFGLIFKVLPDARLPWRDALRGGLWTSALFTFGKLGIGLYLGRASVGSAYGAVGSLVVLLVWVYYSAQIVLFGAELTRAYAEAEGRHGAPKQAARRATGLRKH
ncbi:MAG: YihY/virulence factor BrkB family protein [Elusimicrobiota bacterium]|nr:MAG: YihY/virulence factor BrkB family protein [Elusimicrobiota bacterium]